jgi:hypothetical protein
VATVALIAGCSVVGMLVWAPSGFRASPGAGAGLADGEHAEQATETCTINGAVFLRSLVTSCVTSPAAAASSADGIPRRTASSAQRDLIDKVRSRRPRRATTTDAIPGADTPPAGRAPVVVATPGAPVAPLPAPVDPVPSPVPVDPVQVLPPPPLDVLDPLLEPIDDGVVLDAGAATDLGLDLDLGLGG